MAVEEELPDWLKPSMPEEEQPEWLQPTTVAEIPPPPTPDVPEDEPEDSYWSQFTKWVAVPAVRTLLNLQDIKQADVGTAGRAVARAGVRSAEDLVNTANDFTNALGVTPITERVNWEEEWLGKPENAVEEIAAEMGSWITAFAGPGGVVKSVLKTFSTTTKISSKADDVIKLIGKTEKGRKALTVGRIAGEGALKGAVADFLTTDVDDVEAEEALYKRLTNTIEGAAIGAGFNLAVFGAIKGAKPTTKFIEMYFRRAKALRAVKRASVGKGDATAALKQLKESLDEEAALKEEILTAIRPIDDRVDRITVDDERRLEAIREGREFDALFREVGGDPEDIPEVDLSTVNWDEIDLEDVAEVAPRLSREELETLEAGGKLINEQTTSTGIVKTYELPSGSKRTVMVDINDPERVIAADVAFAPKAVADLDATYGQINPALKKDFYDKTLVEQVSQRMQTGKPMTAREALQDLSDRTNGNLGEYSPIVKKLLALGDETGIDARIEERSFASNIPEVASKIRGSFYDSEGRRIVLDAQDSSVKNNPVYNLLHESTHAVTVDNVVKHYDRNAFGSIAIEDVAGRAAFIDNVLKQKDLPKPIAEMFRMFKKADGMRDEIAAKGKLVTTEGQPDLYWIKNPMEFMSMAFSDPQLQRALKGIQYTPKMTMWEKIVDTVKSFFGKGVSTDLADNIVSRVGEIAEMKLPTQRGVGVEGMPTGREARGVPKFAEDQIEDYINKGQDLPDQVNRLVRLNVELDKTMNPKINGLVERLSEFDVDLEKGITKDLRGQFEGIKGDVLNLEEDLIKYRKMIDLRAKAGNLSGKLLVSFKGNSKMNFRKPIKYKPAVQKQFESIDRLLSLIDGIKSGELTNDNILKALKKELSNADELANTGDLRSIIDKEFGLTVDDAIDTIWGKYKERISNQVLKTLRLNKGTNKAALDMFSQRLTKNLTDAVQVSKPIVKKVNQTLDNLQDILNNPEKYKESIDVLIKDISEAKNLDPQKAAEATRILNELKEGAFGKRFLESMPQRDKMIQKVLSEEVEDLTAKIKQAVKGGTEKELVEDVITDISKRITNLSPNEKQVLVDMIRVELANSISAMRERILGNFISKEIYQKYALKHTIEELEEMADKSIAEIREYLGASAKKAQTVPADIKRLKDQARAARKVLTDKLKEEEAAAYNEFVVQFLKSLSKMDAFGMEEMGTFELLLRTGEKFRLNAMLASIRTWTVGFLSASFNMGYLPFKQMLKKYNEIKIRQAQGDAVYGPEVSAMKLALQELKATSEYFNNWGDMLTILKATWKQNGHGAFNAKAFRRHEEDLIQKTAKQETEALKKGPLKLNFKNKDQLQRMVNKYGVDSDRNRGLLRKFLEETVEGEPTTAVGKMLDPLFSVSFRVMGLFDQPFVFMGTMRALRSEAMQEGLLKGLEGKALDQFAKKRMSEALKRDGDVLTWAQNEEFHEASELGFAMVYQQEYADKVISRLARDFSRWSRSSEDAYRDPIKIVSRLLVPFIKTPTAIAQWTVDNLPVLAHYNWAKATLGSTRSAKKLKEVEQTILKNTEALKSDVIPKEEIKKIEDANEVLFEQRNELTLKKAEEQAEAAANGISSTVLGAGIMTGIATGNITGSGAHLSDDQRARLREAGWRPNTLYIGGYKIDYSRFEPFSTMMSVHADLIHYLMLSGEELTPDDQEWYNVLHASFVTNFSDKYFLRGLKSVFSLLDYKPGNYAMESAAVDFLSSFSPSLLRDLNQVNQEFQTRANSFKDKLLERAAGVFPGLYARNLLGEKVERQWQREGAWGVLSPVYFAEDKRDKLMTELASIREDVGGRYSFNKTEKEKIDTREFKNPKTKLSLYDEWMDKMSKVTLGGKTLRRSLETLIKTQRYKKAPNFEVSGIEDTKAKLVREKIKQYRDRAWIEIRKDRKIRKYQNAQGEAWFDVITGKLLEPNRRTTASDDIVDISLPKQ